jgi:prevent-host-death family protein
MKVNILEAKNQLSKLVKAAANGKEIIIASNGTPVAKLVPLDKPRKVSGWGTLKVSSAAIDAAFSEEIEQEVARAFERQ